MKANKQTAQTMVLWHPNFRVVATLPDTKVIRTSFLINSAAVAVVLATGALLVQRELELSNVRARVAAWSARIEENKPRYMQAAKLQGQFTEAEKRLMELNKFVSSDFVGSAFLRRLAETLPKFVTIDTAEMYGPGVRLRGTIVGPSGKATDIATSYVNQLRSDPLFSTQIQSVMLNSITREPEANRMVFAIEMTLKPRK